MISNVPKKYKVGVIGSRTFTNRKFLFDFLDSKYDKIEMIISGGAAGVDELGAIYAKERGFSCLQHFARWKERDGSTNRSAGFKRNHLIINDSEIVVCMWSKKYSSGTAHSLYLAHKSKKKVILFVFDESNQEDISQVDLEMEILNNPVFDRFKKGLQPYEKEKK